MSTRDSQASEETPDAPSTAPPLDLGSSYPPTSCMDEHPHHTSDEESKEKDSLKVVDTRTPAAPPVLEPVSDSRSDDLQKGFDLVLGVLRNMGPLKFALGVFGPDLSGIFTFHFRLQEDVNECIWECNKTLADLRRLAERIQKERNLRGLGTSVPPLPEKKSQTDHSNLAQSEIVFEFVRAMFTNIVFLGYPWVLNTFGVPGIVRTRIDTFAKLYQTPLLSTWLNKEGGKYKTWKRRWVVLYPDFTLRYYDSENEETRGGKGFRGMVDIQALDKIHHHKIDATKKWIFGLVLKHSWQEKTLPREYKFETTEYSVQRIWVRAVKLLKDGELSRYIPKITRLDAATFRRIEELRMTRTNPSALILQQEKQSNDRLLEKLGEMRQEQDNFTANDRLAKQEFMREQQKLEDEWNNLRPNLEAARKALTAGKEGIHNLKRQLKADTELCMKDMEEAEKIVQEARLKYNLRTGINPVPLLPNKGSKRKITVIENTAPAALGGQLDMYTSPTLLRRRDIWFVMIDGSPFLEWTDLAPGMDADSATRMQIGDVSFGPTEDGEHRSFTVRSAKKNKQVNLVTLTDEECYKWVRTIKNGLGLSVSSCEDEKEDLKEEKLPDNFSIPDLEISGDIFPAEEKHAEKNLKDQSSFGAFNLLGEV